MDVPVYEAARSDMMIAGSRAATLLKLLLNSGSIPAHHVSHVREIVEGHDAARTAWHASMGLPQEVARA